MPDFCASPAARPNNCWAICACSEARNCQKVHLRVGRTYSAGQKPCLNWISLWRVLAHFEEIDRPGRNLWFPARWGAFYSRRCLGGILARTGFLKGLVVVPGHPRCRILGQLNGVFLQLGEVVER